MEFPHMGQQCAAVHCNQLDFLPLQCQCGKIFCSNHLHGHLPQCVETKNVTLSADELKKIENIYVCSKPGCKLRSIVPLICERCQKHYCIQHRHLTECEPKTEQEIALVKEKYSEPVRQFQQAKAAVDDQVKNSLNEARKKSKNSEMAIKLQLMKIKNKATGQKSIPSTDRVYFSVFYPQADETEKNVAVFVSKSWSLGRTIDAVATECKLVNNNNKSNEKKLRLFKKCDNEPISSDLTVTIEKLIEEKTIFNGDDLVVRYVDNGCIRL